MNYRPALFSALTFVCVIISATPAAAENAKPKNKDLIDFTHQDVERSGMDVSVKNRYEWASGSWDKNLLFLEKRGLLVNFVDGKGNFGGANSWKLTDCDFAYLIVIIGNRNQAKSIKVGMTDADGSEVTWNVPLAGQPIGTPLVCKMPLAKPDHVEKPGKVEGLDKAKIRKWLISGDWQDAKVEVLLVKLGAAS